MEQKFCARCGALLGRNEYNFVEGLDGVVCDSCAFAEVSVGGLDAEYIAQRYEVAPMQESV